MISINEVFDFIHLAPQSDLEEIKEKLLNQGINFDCHECSNHDDDCDCYCNCEVEINEASDEARSSLIKELVAQVNAYGVSDMIENLRNEGIKINVWLKQPKGG